MLTQNTPLADLEADCWRQLVSAPKRKRSALKTMTLATSVATGADARTVVLRQADAGQKYIWFHTNAHAAKVIQLEQFPNATLLFWDSRQQLQLRMLVETRLHTDDFVADEHWKNLWAGGRKTYLSEKKPGTELPEPYPGFPPHFGENLPTDAESEAGRPNFAVIECRVLQLDYLRLGRAGQTRARFQYEPKASFTWLAP